MTCQIVKSERLECPPEFQAYLTDIFGVNEFGSPYFRIIWGQTETYQAATAHGYEQRLIGHNQPAWIIQKWLPPDCYGMPETYYWINADYESGLCLLGEYPEFGRYETIQPLASKKYDPATNELIVETIPLDWEIIERVIPVLVASQELTYWQRKTAIEDMEAAENAQKVSEIADRLMDSLPSFYGPTSYNKQAIRTSVLDRKMFEIQQVWSKHRVQERRQPRRGFHQEAV